MLKKWIFYASLVSIVTFISSGFKSINPKDYDWFHVDVNESLTYTFPSLKQNDYKSLNIPFKGRFFIGYKEAIAFRESQGKYRKINTLGYMGKYQFGTSTLRTVGIHDSSAFLNSPRMQEKAFVALLAKNKWELKDEIEKFEGKIIGGIRITESGMLAAAHLGGAGSVRKFLNTNGRRKCRDGYGTSVKSYLKDFAGYETSGIEADNSARVR
jgi:hypothetical protein